MIIANSKRFIFVHLHKCAGSNVTRTLSPGLAWNDIEIGATKLGERIQAPYREKYGLHKHSPARDIRAVVGDRIWDDYFTFAFVRNPYARAVSLYTFIQRLSEIKRRGLKRFTRPFSKDADGGFWSWPLTQAYRDSRNFSGFIRHDNFEQAAGSQPQFHALSNDERTETIVDFIGRVENFDDDFAEIMRCIGIKECVPEKKRSSSKQHYQSYYRGKEDYAIITRAFEPDFEFLEYEVV